MHGCQRQLDMLVSRQWRREDFDSVGGDTWPPMGNHAPDAGGPGAKAPRMVAKFNILKRFKVLENESIFQKYHHFSCPKKSIFSKKNFETLNIFYKIF